MVVIGMDLHVRNSYLQVMDDSGRSLKRGRIHNNMPELAEFLEPFSDQPMTVSLESTTNSRSMHQLLEQYGEQAGVDLTAQVLDARKLRVIAESVNKSDKVDARILAELTRSGMSLPQCYVPDDEVFALREHLRHRSDLVRMRTMLKNRVHALLHRRGIAPPPKLDIFTSSGRHWLAQCELDESGRSLVDQTLSAIEAIDRQIDHSNDQLDQCAQSQRWCVSQGLLQTMPGVGQIVALTVLAELGDISRFTSRDAVANFAGLVPVQRESNEKQSSGKLTKRGSKHLRRVMIQAAWQAIGRSSKYHNQYERIKARRGWPKAIVAVARKMLEDMYTMLKHHTVFRDSAEAAG